MTASAVRPSLGPAPARIPELDGLRGMAILLVLVYHYFVVSTTSTGETLLAHVARRLSLAWSGVDLFFVLSGFLIGGILIDNRDSPSYYQTFYLRRACRIFPLYFLWLATFALLLAVVPGLSSSPRFALIFDPTVPLWSYATFTQNAWMSWAGVWGPQWLAITWSLAIEEQFYILLPVVVRLVRPRRLPCVLVAGILAAPIIRIALYNFHPHFLISTYVLMPCRADALLLGVLGAYAVRRPGFAAFLAADSPGLYAVFTVLLLGTALLTLTPAWIGSPGATYFGYSWLALLYLCFTLLAVTERRGPVRKLAATRLLRRLGQVSYAVYMFHEAVLWLAHGLIRDQTPRLLTASDVVVTVLALALTVGLAAVSWTAFERRFVDLGHTFAYRKAGPHSGTPAETRQMSL